MTSCCYCIDRRGYCLYSSSRRKWRRPFRRRFTWCSPAFLSCLVYVRSGRFQPSQFVVLRRLCLLIIFRRYLISLEDSVVRFFLPDGYCCYFWRKGISIKKRPEGVVSFVSTWRNGSSAFGWQCTIEVSPALAVPLSTWNNREVGTAGRAAGFRLLRRDWPAERPIGWDRGRCVAKTKTTLCCRNCRIAIQWARKRFFRRRFQTTLSAASFCLRSAAALLRMAPDWSFRNQPTVGSCLPFLPSSAKKFTDRPESNANYRPKSAAFRLSTRLHHHHRFPRTASPPLRHVRPEVFLISRF